MCVCVQGRESNSIRSHFPFGCISLRTALALVSNKKLQLKTKKTKNEPNYKNKTQQNPNPIKIEWVTHTQNTQHSHRSAYFAGLSTFSSFRACSSVMRAIRVIPNAFDTTFPLYAESISHTEEKLSFTRQLIFFVSINETSK
jgi:hypothetical protein